MQPGELNEALAPEKAEKDSYRKRRRRDYLVSVLLFGVALYCTSCLYYWGWRASHPVSSAETKEFYLFYYRLALVATPLAYLGALVVLLWRPVSRRLKRGPA